MYYVYWTDLSSSYIDFKYVNEYIIIYSSFTYKVPIFQIDWLLTTYLYFVN